MGHVFVFAQHVDVHCLLAMEGILSSICLRSDCAMV
jgi:hypothetical protein